MDQPVIDAEEAGGEAGSAQFLSFALGTETCAVALAAVQEIIRVPRIVGVPLSPPAVAGLVNLRGHVLPVIDGRRVLGFGGEPPGAQARVVVLHQHDDYGLLVDAVAGVIGGAPEPPPAARDAATSEILAGALHAGGRVVMLLDPERLAGRYFVPGTAGVPLADALAPAASREEAEEEVFRYLTFMVAGQQYGLPVQFVQEIGRLPGELSRVPHAASHLVGIAPLRGRLLPLVDLSLLLGLPASATDGEQRVLVAGMPGGAPVGLLVDRVCEVLHAASEPQALPALWEHPGEADLAGMLCLDGGRRLVAVLAAERLLQAVLAQLEREGETMAETTDTVDPRETEDDTETLVVFTLGSEEFGLPVGAVREILRVPEQLSRVPGAADFVEGMVNLRGKVLPVLDQRRQLGLSGGQRDRRQRILVLEGNGASAGFAVDAVREVLEVPRASLGPAPAMRGVQAHLVRRVANLAATGRMILVLDADELLRTAQAPGLQEAA